MLGYFRNILESRRGTPQKGLPPIPEHSQAVSPAAQGRQQQSLTFTKIFRYRLPDGQTEEPASVEVVGSFSHWRPVTMMRDGKLDAWHVTVHHIPGNRTHHYMLLVNGQPYYDRTCDGLAVPHGFDEERYAVATDKGPRVLMLFAQTR